MTSLKAQYAHRGPVPQDVIRTVPFEAPALAPGQVLVAMLAVLAVREEGETPCNYRF